MPQGKEEDIICNRQREVNGHTVTNEILRGYRRLSVKSLTVNRQITVYSPEHFSYTVNTLPHSLHHRINLGGG